MKDYLTLNDVVLDNKRVLVRVDFNSPMDPAGNILDDKRIRSHLDTLRALEDCRVVLMAHQSRAGKKDYTTMEAHARLASRLLRRDVTYIDDIFGSYARKAIKSLMPGEVLLLENTRFYAEENMTRTPAEHAKSHMVRKLSPLFDLFINDAFAVSHRSHCSVVGFTEVLPSIAGMLMDKEITALDKGLKGNEHPTVFSLGGTKADDSIKVTRNALERGGADKILTSGVVAIVFMMAAGIDVGEANRKFIEDQEYLEQIPIAAKLLQDYPGKIILPSDVALNQNGERVEVSVDKLPAALPIADIGLETIVSYSRQIKEAKVAVLNGPTGIFEQEKFRLGTAEILKAATESGYSIAGGGHSVAAIEQLGLESKFSHVSMGGGAAITYLSGEPLPGIEALKSAAARSRKS
ncbi:MAG TPA: phosphoglycerate kinase [Methanothrix sp.]|nr:phosphoglycerate kinase [Methanothrix sp.]HQE87469.1 phosphoglycerate kinase [Methanothrix sp.]HQI68837.1 phosphoglycerate kinase [Methanothrix sp.]